MKATIDKNGCLKITPENELEHYALVKWDKGYYSNNGIEQIVLLNFNQKTNTTKPTPGSK